MTNLKGHGRMRNWKEHARKWKISKRKNSPCIKNRSNEPKEEGKWAISVYKRSRKKIFLKVVHVDLPKLSVGWGVVVIITLFPLGWSFDLSVYFVYFCVLPSNKLHPFAQCLEKILVKTKIPRSRVSGPYCKICSVRQWLQKRAQAKYAMTTFDSMQYEKLLSSSLVFLRLRRTWSFHVETSCFAKDGKETFK